MVQPQCLIPTLKIGFAVCSQSLKLTHKGMVGMPLGIVISPTQVRRIASTDVLAVVEKQKEHNMNIYDIIRQYGLAKTSDQLSALYREKGVKFDLDGDTCGVFTGRDGKIRWQDFKNSSLRGDAIDLIRYLEKCSYVEAKQRLGLESEDRSHSYSAKVSNVIVKREPDEIDKENIAAIRAAMTRSIHIRNSLACRGIDYDNLPKDVADKIGFVTSCRLKSKSKGSMYTIEGIVFDNGDCCKIRKVSIIDGNYSFTPSWGQKNMSIGPNSLFNAEALLDSSNPVFVTEGELDALSVIGNGYKAVSIPGVMNTRLLLSKLAEENLKPMIIIAVDVDAAGLECRELLESKLSELGIKHITMASYGGYKDLNEWMMKDPHGCREGLARAVDIILSIA